MSDKDVKMITGVAAEIIPRSCKKKVVFTALITAAIVVILGSYYFSSKVDQLEKVVISIKSGTEVVIAIASNTVSWAGEGFSSFVDMGIDAFSSDNNTNNDTVTSGE